MKKRNFGLDVIRAISILLVVIAHRFTLKYELGIVGVQMFFVLSGFLIGQILIKDFNHEGTLPIIFNFWKRRWYRTLPLYYFVLVLKIMIYGNPFGWKMIVYFFFLQAHFVGISFLGVSWSLVVEEWFYIFLPIVIFIFFKKGIVYDRFFRFLWIWILFFLIARFGWNYFQKGIIIYQFDCLLLGVLLALVKMFRPLIYKSLCHAFPFFIGLVGVMTLSYLMGDIDEISIYNSFYRVIWYFLISCFIFIMIPFLEQSSFFNRKLQKVKIIYVFFTWTSILTYSIYLLHMEVFQIPFQQILPAGVVLIVQVILLYCICFVVYIFYEHPMLNLRDNFSFKQYIYTIRHFKI